MLTLSASADPSQIDIWYGDSQDFGSPGNPQRWVNVLGTVSDQDGISSLTFTLNGGPSRNLSVGPDTRRLLEAGDFNVEIDYAELIAGQNTVEITAIDSIGTVTTKTVVVNYTQGLVWPSNFQTDWNSATTLADYAQVVDGRWELDGTGVRPSVMGYDRVLAVGDVLWDDYEVEVPITIHGYDPGGFQWPSVAPGIGVLSRWLGHTTLVQGEQPHAYWLPSGGSIWYDYGEDRLYLGGNNGLSASIGSPQIDFGTTYIWKLRAETVSPGNTFYGAKLWQQGSIEPANWTMSGQDGPGDLENGSYLLIAHHIDATFGDVVITDLSNDTVPPVISNIGVSSFTTGVNVFWDTNEPAAGSVSYGVTTSLELDTVSAPAYQTSQQLAIGGLEIGQTYFYAITAQDTDGNLSTSPLDSFTFTGDSPETAITSDDFSQQSLNTDLWVFVNPFGDATLQLNGQQAVISIPANSNIHDVWTSSNDLPRLSQSALDADFDVVAKFDSTPDTGFQSQGLLIEQTDLDLLRIEFHSSNGSLKIFAAGIFGGSATIYGNSNVQPASTLFLRIRRIGNQFTVFHSTDGSSWTLFKQFTRAMTVNEVSVHIGSGADTAYEGVIDFVFESSAPIVPEDGPSVLTADPVFLPSGEVGSAYSAGVTASGGAGPYGWSLISGLLPPGIMFDSDGVFSGTPSDAAGSPFNFGVMVTDAVGAMDTLDLSIVVTDPPPLAIDAITLPDGEVGTTYATQSFTASNGTAPYSWSISAGALPPGLSLASNGTLSGTPTDAVGSPYAFTVMVTDNVGAIDTLALNIIVSEPPPPPPLSIGSITLPAGEVGTAYPNQTFTASNGATPYSWSISAGTLPPGLGLASDGALSGTPTDAVGSPYAFTVMVTDNVGATDTLALNIVVSEPPPLAIDSLTLPDGEVGTAYTTQSLTASNGTLPYSWTVSAGALPPGLSLASDGTLNGTPADATQSPYAFTVMVTDAVGSTDAAALTISVFEPTGQARSDSFDSGTLDTGVWEFVNPLGDASINMTGTQAEIVIPSTAAIHDVWTSSNDVPRLRQSVADGDFDVSVKFDSALATGFKSQGILIEQDDLNVLRIEFLKSGGQTRIFIAELFGGSADIELNQSKSLSIPMYLRVTRVASNFTIYYSFDGTNWTFADSFSRNMTVNAISLYGGSGSNIAHNVLVDQFINLLNPSPPPLTADPVFLPSGEVGSAYSAGVTASGGAGPYGWSLISGLLPPGIMFDSDGVFSGTPSDAAGSPFNFGVMVTDAVGAMDTLDLSIVVTDPPPLAIDAITLPDGEVGTTYATQSFTASNGTAPYSWSISAGALPPGLSLASNGTLSGTPTDAVGSPYAFTVMVTDNVGAIDTLALNIIVSEPPPPPPLSIGSITLPAGEVGTAYPNQTFTASNGATPYSWSISAGTLPPGLGLASDGALSGTPTDAVGSPYAFTVMVTDNVGATDTLALNIVVSEPPPLAIDSLTLPDGEVGTAYTTQSLTASNGTLPYSWTVSAGALPPGLSLASDGTLNGTPADATQSPYAFTVMVTDAVGSTDAAALTISVFEPTGQARSDSFDSGTLDTGVWEFVNPLGDASINMTGTQAEIVIPSTAAIHDVWTSSNDVPRLRQSVADGDFDVSVKFDSALATGFKSQGILIEQDDLNVLRIEFLKSGGQTRIFIAELFGGSADIELNQSKSLSIPMYLRVTRVASNFTIYYSFDGTNWTFADSFSRNMTVNAISLYGGSGSNIAHNVLIDQFDVASQSSGSSVFPFSLVEVDGSYPGNGKPGWSSAGDIDGDGDADIIAGGGFALHWYEAPGWTLHPIENATTVGGNGGLVFDVDGDGDLDVVSTLYNSDLTWWENPGSGSVTGPWVRHTVDSNISSFGHDLALGDIDSDGSIEVVALYVGDGVFWYDIPSDPAVSVWNRVQIAASLGEERVGLAVGDLDQDGDVDVVASNSWFERPGNPSTSAWNERQLFSVPVQSIAVYDINSDTRPDVVAAEGFAYPNGRILWAEAPIDPQVGIWMEHSIASNLDGPENLWVGNLDQDGFPDVVTGEMGTSTGFGDFDSSLLIYQNDGVGNWNEEVVRENVGVSARIHPVDIDGDGDIDFTADGNAESHVYLWVNER
ncbi:MAG: putative Ig domain-containing protein [Pseudomonadales bacterium]